MTDTFVNLHTHSEFSALDGLSKVDEIIDTIAGFEQTAVAITDHGVCASHSLLQRVADAKGIKPIFGLEAYFVDDRLVRPEAGDKEKQIELKDGYYHLVLWAMDDQGLRNLWAMSTAAYREGYYYRPRIDWEVLERFNEGIICSTACLRGPVTTPLLPLDEERSHPYQNRPDLGVANLLRLKRIFGDRLYIEFHVNEIPKQIAVNYELIKLSQEYNVPLVAAVDSHYPCAGDQSLHAIWIAMQTNKDLQDESDLFSNHEDYHLMSGDEVYARMAKHYPQEVIQQAIANTKVVADRCNARISGETDPPIFSKPTQAMGGLPKDELNKTLIEQDVKRLTEICLANWDRKVKGKSQPEDVYIARFEEEMRMYIDKKFCGYFNIVADYSQWSKHRSRGGRGCIMGPSRGSGGACLVAYLADITEIDPIENNLPLARFMTRGRMEPPDFDLDWPASMREELTDYVVNRWGESQVVRVGTHIRLKNKGAFQNVVRVFKSTRPVDPMDLKAIGKIIDDEEADSAGLGKSWDLVYTANEDLFAPYVKKYPWLFEIVEGVVGRLKSYGKHAAGLVISTGEPLVNRLPMRVGDDGRLISDFDFPELEALGLLKFDFLTLRTLDTIQECVDRIYENHGVKINIYDWKDEYFDPEVWKRTLAVSRTMGLFQVETAPVTALNKRIKPMTMAELSAVITLVRPGPTRSGLTESYIRRKFGKEEIILPDNRLADALSETFGCIVYQEDIINTCKILARYDDEEADAVRKILGKKKVEKVIEAGNKFIPACVDNEMKEEDAQLLWSQMAEFAKYCVSGDTKVHLAASGRNSDGTISAEDLYRKINAPLLPAKFGKVKLEDQYKGPCVVCGSSFSPKWQRGACQSCYVWRQKFQNPLRGVYGLTVDADSRVRPSRILMVHKHEPALTFTIALADGKTITATANHKHLTPNGLRRVDELAIGDCLLVDAGYEMHKYGPGEYRTTEGQRLLEGSVNNAFGDENYGYVDGGYGSLMAWTAQAPEFCESCGHDGSINRLERAHLDGRRINNDWSNLKMLCVSCHKKFDYQFNERQKRWGKGHPTQAVTIISIEEKEVEPVYSVVMDDPHIWIANGIATSNSFNKAHAFGYAVLCYWTAWFKTHYPQEFMASLLSTVDNDRIPDFVNECRILDIPLLPPNINLSGPDFTIHGDAIMWGFEGIKGIAGAATKAIMQGQPYSSFDDFMERKGAACHSNHIAMLAGVGAFDDLVPNRRSLMDSLAYDESEECGRCVDWVSKFNEYGLPCKYDWNNEPVELTKTGKPKKRKPVPKRCTKACRNYRPSDKPDFSVEDPYTEEDIRDMEMKYLGVWLSSTPFDRLDPNDLQMCLKASELDDAPAGDHLVAAMVKKVTERIDSNGNQYAWLGLYAQDGDLDLPMWNQAWKKFGRSIVPGKLYVTIIRKTIKDDKPRMNVSSIMPLE